MVAEKDWDQALVSQCCGKPGIPEIDLSEHGASGLCSGCREFTMFEPATCPECDGPADDRVLGGMKCGPCAYGSLVDEVYGDPDMAEEERSDAAAEAWEAAGDLRS